MAKTVDDHKVTPKVKIEVKPTRSSILSSLVSYPHKLAPKKEQMTTPIPSLK